jgi:hypothetical protein
LNKTRILNVQLQQLLAKRVTATRRANYQTYTTEDHNRATKPRVTETVDSTEPLVVRDVGAVLDVAGRFVVDTILVAVEPRVVVALLVVCAALDGARELVTGAELDDAAPTVVVAPRVVGATLDVAGRLVVAILVAVELRVVVSLLVVCAALDGACELVTGAALA